MSSSEFSGGWRVPQFTTSATPMSTSTTFSSWYSHVHSGEEESLVSEKEAGKIQVGDKLSVVCPICEHILIVEVVNRYMHPQTSTHRRDEIDTVYVSKLCDCPDITIKGRNNNGS